MQRGKNLPPIENIQQLEENLSRPSEDIIKIVEKLDGDILILGVAGKMGPSIAKMLKRSIDKKNLKNKVIGISRFSDEKVRETLNKSGIETIKCDLLEETSFKKFPASKNIIYLTGMKFGSTGKESLTWAVNTYIPSLVVKNFPDSKIVALSTGNVYPFVPTEKTGSDETTTPGPVGEYAQSCLGRERIFQYFSEKYKTPVTLIRLNYSVELRYGVLVDIAQKVLNGQEIDLRMGYANVIWQTDANRYIIRSFDMVSSPPALLNVTGKKFSVRQAAENFGEIFKKQPVFANQEEKTALLSDASLCHEKYGSPEISTEQMIHWIAHWLGKGGQTHGKPTHFETKNGKF
jgi:nucleoside-diphosphate-sugar epimerase